MFHARGLAAPLLLVIAGCIASSGAPSSAASRSGRPSAAMRAYDGEVIGVDRRAPEESLSSNVRLVLRPASNEPVTVELAPGWYLEEQGVQLSPKQRMKVRGRDSQTAGGGRTMVAWEIETGNRVIPLRDAKGRPIWGRPAP
jgi:hypothetical protein